MSPDTLLIIIRNLILSGIDYVDEIIKLFTTFINSVGGTPGTICRYEMDIKLVIDYVRNADEVLCDILERDRVWREGLTDYFIYNPCWEEVTHYFELIGRKKLGRFHIKVLKKILKTCMWECMDEYWLESSMLNLSLFLEGFHHHDWDKRIIKKLLKRVQSFFPGVMEISNCGLYLYNAFEHGKLPPNYYGFWQGWGAYYGNDGPPDSYWDNYVNNHYY